MYTDDFENYVFSLLESLQHVLTQNNTSAIRFIPAETTEPGYWIAYNGFNFEMTNTKKLPFTISPVISFYHMKSPASFIVVNLDNATNFLAMSYTAALKQGYAVEYEDPVTKTPAYPEELEVSVYIDSETRAILMDEVNYSRLMRLEESIPESVYYAHKSLCYRIHHRSYARYHYTLIKKRKTLISLLAILYLNNKDSRFTMDFSIAWDRYWERLGKLNSVPNYENVFNHPRYRDNYKSRHLLDDIFEYAFYRFANEYCLLPARIIKLIINDVHEECLYILNLLQAELPEVGLFPMPQPPQEEMEIYPDWAYSISAMHPDLFPTPRDVVRIVRSDPFITPESLMTYDSAIIRLLKEIKHEKEIGKVMKPEWDDDIIIEDAEE